jgi:ribosomal protein L20
MAEADVQLNRKVLQELAIHEPKSFAAVAKFSRDRAETARQGLAGLLL